MQLRSLELQNFRSYSNAFLTFDPRLTTLVGENNTGKSSIGAAIWRALSGGGFPQEELPYGVLTRSVIALTLALSTDEMSELRYTLGLLRRQETADQKYLHWLESLGNDLTIQLLQTPERSLWMVRLGQVTFKQDGFTLNTAPEDLDAVTGAADAYPPRIDHVFNNLDGAAETWLQLPFSVPQHVSSFLTPRVKRVEEFRVRAQPGQRSSAMETMSGLESASILLNLKNHWQPLERARYRQILDTFNLLFPRYRVEAVEESPGSPAPSIQFIEEARHDPLALWQLSAGVHQVLGFLVNLIGQQGRVVFIEHPEQHLHPHGMRFLLSVIKAASEMNQIVVVTHDPHFVSPEGVIGLRRVWWTQSGSLIRGLDPQLSEKQRGQVLTVLRSTTDREVVFGRSVLLVEDESQKLFILGVAPRLEFNAHGVSVVSVNGEDGFSKCFTLLDALAIPYVALKDKNWGDPIRYPANRFWSFGCELEEYLDTNGLADLRAEVIAEVGTSDTKARVARVLPSRLTIAEVPGLFKDVLQAAQNAATGEPSTLT
jgi:hypothetical protein